MQILDDKSPKENLFFENLKKPGYLEVRKKDSRED